MGEVHRLVFEGDSAGLEAVLMKDVEDVNALDVHGNTPLMIAVMLGRTECAELLIKHGADATKKNKQKWSALAEAVSLGDRQLVVMVMKAAKAQLEKLILDKTAKIINAIESIQDFYIEISWEFHSWVPLVSRVLPNDVFRLWKVGSSLRLDSTLFDVSERSLKRGHMTFIFEGRAEERSIGMTAINHSKKKFIRRPFRINNVIRSEVDETDDGEGLEEDIDILMTSELTDVDMSSETVTFQRALSGWLGFRAERSEVAADHMCKVFNIDGMNLVTRIRREHLTPEDIRRNKEYQRRLKSGEDTLDDPDIQPLRRSLPPPEREPLTWDQYLQADTAPHIGRPLKMTTKTRHLKAVAWISDDFPLDIKTFTDLLTIIAPSGKHVERLRDFLNFKMPPGFPVKLDIPIFPTVSARVVFQNYKLYEEKDAGLFDVPEGFVEVTDSDEDDDDDKDKDGDGNDNDNDKEGDEADGDNVDGDVDDGDEGEHNEQGEDGANGAEDNRAQGSARRRKNAAEKGETSA